MCGKRGVSEQPARVLVVTTLTAASKQHQWNVECLRGPGAYLDRCPLVLGTAHRNHDRTPFLELASCGDETNIAGGALKDELEIVLDRARAQEGFVGMHEQQVGVLLRGESHNVGTRTVRVEGGGAGGMTTRIDLAATFRESHRRVD